MYFKIYDWMLSDLKLGGNELLVYSLIYSFQEQRKVFYGSWEFIKKMTGIKSRDTIYRTLNKLLEKGLINKLRNAKGCEYRVSENRTLVVRKSDFTSTKIGHNNTNNNTNNIIYNETQYIEPSEEELEWLMSPDRFE